MFTVIRSNIFKIIINNVILDNIFLNKKEEIF